MTRDEAVARIQEGLGFRSSLSTVIIARLKEEQRDLERGKTLPPFMLLEGQTLSLTASINFVALPATFLRRSNLLPRYTPTGAEQSKTIPWRNYDAAQSQWESEDPAGPAVAVLRQSTIVFFPTPDTAYTVTWDYYQKAVVLDTNVENLWLANASELLIGGAGLRIAMDLRNKSATELFDVMYKKARLAWFNETIEQTADDGPMLLGANA